jgi:hypothetical protein
MNSKLQIKAAQGTEGPAPLLWDIKSAADRLSLSTISVRRLIQRQLLPRHPASRKVLISERALQEFADRA